MSLLDMFSGGAFSNASIFALGIMPYISASIVMQLVAIAVPSFQKMQREGASGHKKIAQYTRYLTVAILLFQAPSYLLNLKMTSASALASGLSWTEFMIPAVFILSAGSMFILWLGERITDKGVGNGVSMIIMIGIIARFPQAFIQEVSSRFTAITGGGLVMFIVEILILYAVVCAAILLTQATRKVPVEYAKKLVGNSQVGGVPSKTPTTLTFEVKEGAVKVYPAGGGLRFYKLAFTTESEPPVDPDPQGELECPDPPQTGTVPLDQLYGYAEGVTGGDAATSANILHFDNGKALQTWLLNRTKRRATIRP